VGAVISLSPDMQLVADVLGREAALTLMERLGGLWLYVPKGVDDRAIELVRSLMTEDGRLTKPVKEVARLCLRSQRTVYRIIADLRAGRA
jgi:hypothetical protein